MSAEEITYEITLLGSHWAIIKTQGSYTSLLEKTFPRQRLTAARKYLEVARFNSL